ncbi:hypothetical protein POTOM_018070 [Populus tomentosa]|uniref:Uncharacterized protein n=1 Tax=Populus tomentosa TaxID=118781 RepID=A0A8X7ZYJ2_POPTO|nr:hypothetical protein POTOM_018070 [Populus tomentosa]
MKYHQVCRSLQAVTDKEINSGEYQGFASSLSKEPPPDVESTGLPQNSGPSSNTEGDGVSSVFDRRRSLGSRKTGKKRRTKYRDPNNQLGSSSTTFCREAQRCCPKPRREMTIQSTYTLYLMLALPELHQNPILLCEVVLAQVPAVLLEQNTNITGSSNEVCASVGETSNGASKRTCSCELAEMHSLNNQGEPTFLVSSQIHKTRSTNEHIHQSQLEIPPYFCQSSQEGGALRRELGLQPNWGLKDLQKVIGKCFKVHDFTGIVLKYMDDDGDLGECKEIPIQSRYTITNILLYLVVETHSMASIDLLASL